MLLPLHHCAAHNVAQHAPNGALYIKALPSLTTTTMVPYHKHPDLPPTVNTRTCPVWQQSSPKLIADLCIFRQQLPSPYADFSGSPRGGGQRGLPVRCKQIKGIWSMLRCRVCVDICYCLDYKDLWVLCVLCSEFITVLSQ